MKYKTLSIQDQGGLQPYLDSDNQKKRHSGKGYDDFVHLYGLMKQYNLAKTEVMKAMQVKSAHTINSWIELYESGQK